MPVAPAAAIVVTLNGLAALPEPLTAVWLTGVNAVLSPMPLAADASCAAKSGANSVPPTKTSVPQSPGYAEDGKSSRRASPEWATWQLSSSPSATLVSGPAGETISLNGTAACAVVAAAAAIVSAVVSAAVQARVRRCMRASLRRRAAAA
jgi:hypothetical protein